MTCNNGHCAALGGSGVLINNYQEFRRSYLLTERPAYSSLVGTAKADTVTVFVHNSGQVPLLAHLQNSPDGQVFVDDKQVLTLGPDETGIMTPYYFSKYMRMVMHSPSGEGQATLWFQIQSRDYRLCL